MLKMPLFLAVSLPLASLLPASEERSTQPAPQSNPPAGKESRPLPPTREAGSSPDFKFPWRLDHEYHFSWVFKRAKAGESTFRISEVEVPAGDQTKKLYLSKSHYTYKNEGGTQDGRYETYFDTSWKPVRYTCRKNMSGLKNMVARQDHIGEIQGGRLVTKIVHNGDEPNALRLEMEAPPDAYLFLNQAMDNWAIIVSNLLRGPTTYQARVIYPDFIKVFDMKFTFEKEEPVDLGKEKKPLCRLYSFRDPEGQYVGKVWLNREGQMVLHEQGDLRVYLED